MIEETVIRVVDQALACSITAHSLPRRDIKPENILCTLADPSTIKIIDLGISKLFSCGQPSKYDPLKDRRHIVGSLYWASLNSHIGLDLAPRDDLESLAFVALSLLRGHLPWKPHPRLESQLHSREVVRLMKIAYPDPVLSIGFPEDFSQMLSYSRSLDFNELPDFLTLRHAFASLADRMGYSLDSTPLDWTPCYPQITNVILDEHIVSISDEDEDDCDGYNLGEDTYCAWDISMWERQGERDKDSDVTLPAQQETDLDNIIPLIVDVQK